MRIQKRCNDEDVPQRDRPIDDRQRGAACELVTQVDDIEPVCRLVAAGHAAAIAVCVRAEISIRACRDLWALREDALVGLSDCF